MDTRQTFCFALITDTLKSVSYTHLTQEQKYSAELDKALDEYAELKAQAADFDPVELYEARQADVYKRQQIKRQGARKKALREAKNEEEIKTS